MSVTPAPPRARSSMSPRTGMGTPSAVRTCALLALLPILWLAGCRTHPRIDGPPPKVEFRLAEFDATEGYVEMKSRQGERIFVASEAVIDLEDVHTSLIRRQGADDFLYLGMKTGSRIRLDAVTQQHLEKPVVVLFNDEVVYAPILRTSISRQVPVRIGRDGIAMEEAKLVLEAVADQRDFGPWSQRAAAHRPGYPGPPMSTTVSPTPANRPSPSAATGAAESATEPSPAPPAAPGP